MAWVQMILDFLVSLVWPAVVVTVLMMFRPQAQSFLGDLHEVVFLAVD
ncbi:hypothetical protein [Rhodococcus sp. 14-2496-1d]|nr:hypothetical protein [Rhodococcus sp. 14-2496-1d]